MTISLAASFYAANGGITWREPGEIRYPLPINARPLVVIDPEDREQVARLADAFCTARWSHIDGSNECDPLTRTSMKEALDAYLNPTPPKPDEPTGLGAVVEDASQVEFIHLGSGLWVYGTTDGPSKGFTYADIAAVRVLSEGVTPC